MLLNRRAALGVIGGGTILAATGATGYLATRQPSAALLPWQRVEQYQEPRRKALSYAILAPNPHNLQPWIVDLSEPDTVLLFRDEARDLPETDPFSRQLTIGLGCFLELLRIAASNDGHALDLTLFPDGEGGPVARAKFRDGGEPDPLFPQILDRRSCKEPFQDRAIPAALTQDLAPFATVITAADEVAALRDLTWRAWKVETETPRTYKESIDLMRLGAPEIETNPDGIDLGGGFLEILIALRLLSRDAMLDSHSYAYQEGIRMYEELLAATPAYVTVDTAANAREDQIDAGRRWLRLNLKTTELGLSLHPVSQALQEYPEMAKIRRQAHDMLAKPGHTVQMLGRLGFGPEVGPSPRWPLKTRIKNGPAHG